MFEATIEDIQKNFQVILEQTGNNSFVDWSAFIKSNRELDKTFNHLSTCIAHLRQIQHQRFISTMKLIISVDIPAMINFVNSKRLPASALNNILNWFTIKQNKVQLQFSVEQLKQQSIKLFENLKQNDTKVITLTNQIIFLLSEKIKPLLVLDTDNEKNAYLKASLAYQNMITNENKIQTNHMPQSVEEQQRSTYSQLKQGTFILIIEQYKRITNDARKNRRSLIKNHPQYLKSIIQYLTDTEELIIEGYKTAGDILGLDIEKFLQVELFQKGNDKIMLNMKEQMHEKLKLSPSTKVEVQLAKKIFEFQIEVLEWRVQFFKDLFRTMEKTSFNLTNTGKILMLSLQDIVFEKFNKQEQDFSNYIEQSFLAKNSEVEELIKRVALKMHEVFQKIGMKMNQHIIQHQKKHGASFQIYLMERAVESLQATASNTSNQEEEEAKID